MNSARHRPRQTAITRPRPTTHRLGRLRANDDSVRMNGRAAGCSAKAGCEAANPPPIFWEGRRVAVPKQNPGRRHATLPLFFPGRDIATLAGRPEWKVRHRRHKAAARRAGKVSRRTAGQESAPGSRHFAPHRWSRPARSRARGWTATRKPAGALPFLFRSSA
jgi:hypothetical protein